MKACNQLLLDINQYGFLGVLCRMLAFVMANSEPEKSEWVLERIADVEGVKEAYRIWGVYDIIAVVKAESIVKLKEKILNIRQLKHVLSTTTLMVVK